MPRHTRSNSLKVPNSQAQGAAQRLRLSTTEVPVDPKAVLPQGTLWWRISALFRSESAPAAMSFCRHSTYGTDNTVSLDAVAAPQARTRLWSSMTRFPIPRRSEHGQAARGNTLQLGSGQSDETGDDLADFEKRPTIFGGHTQINTPPAKIIEIVPVLDKVPIPVVFHGSIFAKAP